VKTISLSDGGLAYRIEKEKARQMSEILASETDLTTPNLLDVDDDRGSLVFERLPAMRPLSASEGTIWFERIGRALAVVHRKLALPGELTIVRTVDRGSRGTVFVHGDFMPNNLGIRNGQLVVFDWGLRPWTSEVYTCAAGSVDLAAFLAPWLVPLWWDLRLPLAKLSATLQAYFDGIGHQSATADLVVRTLDDEIAGQYQYWTASIRSRSAVRQPLALLKLRLNKARLELALAKFGVTHRKKG